jgi:GNAT superfamily N-acetyltransferase
MQSRLATAADSEIVSQLLNELVEESNTRGGFQTKTPLNLKERKKMFLNLLKREDVKIFVIEKEKQVLAVADVFIIPVMRRSVNRALIEDFVVTKNMRGKGIGTMLMRTIMKYCKEQNIHVIKLTSGLELEPAHRFYEKMGGKFTEKMYRFEV